MALTVRDIKRSTTITIILVSMCLSLFSFYAVAILIFGILPAFIAMSVDNTHNNSLTKIILPINVAGLLPYMMQIIKSNAPAQTSLEIMLSARSWMLIYATPGIGWALYWVCPKIAMVILPILQIGKIERLKQENKSLAEEWGDSVYINIEEHTEAKK